MVVILKLNSETFLIFVKPYVFVSLRTVPSFKSISYVVININGKKQTERHNGKPIYIGNTFAGTFFLVFM